jgi:hypothetical protein
MIGLAPDVRQRLEIVPQAFEVYGRLRHGLMSTTSSMDHGHLDEMITSGVPSPHRSPRWAQVAALWFVFSTALLVWPIYPWVGNHVHPRVLGLPWSLVWVLLVIATNAVVLNVLYRRRLVDDRELDEPEPEAHDPETPR